MDARTLERLEFHKVIELLTGCATFAVGQEYCRGLRPQADLAEVLQGQKETTEAFEVYRKEPDLPLGGMKDIRGFLRKVGIGGVLEPGDLLDVAETIRAMRRLKKFFSHRFEQYPIFGELVREMVIHKEVEEKITGAVDSGGGIADNASASLKRIRAKIRETELAVKSKMDHIIRSGEYQKYFQEAIITMRSDRYVIPVKQEYRGQFPGIIHDQSASGATVFIEPVAVVELNNSLRRLLSEQEQEIIRILTELSSSVKNVMEDLQTGTEILGKIDFIMAKGKLAHRMNATEPALNLKGYINLKKARHPLITGDVVPIDLVLGKEFNILVITGPNTGGKTVTLKTVGLITAMAQSGLHIPCESGSEAGVFENIFADIGDEQSIEQSLSTFSGHMKNIIEILQKAGEKSLVLVDELGSGTDPTEGAALAMSILEDLHGKRAKAIATTHYSELKVFAFQRREIENASVEFDTKTLRPTYKLLIGQPGRSSAFEIAFRLGLKEDIISRSREFLTKEQVRVSDLVEDLEVNRKKAEEEKIKAQQIRREIQLIREEYDTKLKAFEERRKALMEKAKEEAAALVRQARKEAEESVRDLRKALLEKKVESLTEAEAVRDRLKKLEDEKSGELFDERAARKEVPTNLREGDKVFLPRFNQTGYVITPPAEDGQLMVQAGVLKINVHVSEVRRTKEAKKAETKGPVAGKLMVSKAREAKTELDIRGHTMDEAMPELEKFLDDAFLAGLPQVQIIHGKGTGVLRKMVKELLVRHRYVDEYRLGIYGEGGTGVTVVKIKA